MTDRDRLVKRLNRHVAAALDLSIPGHARRRHARHAAHYGVKLGIIPRIDRCQRCGEAGQLEKHHTDYSRPLCVQFLCAPCHDIADAEMHGGRIDRDGDRAA